MGFEKTLTCAFCSRTSPVFCFLKEDELSRIEDSRIEVEYKPGETIVKSGTPITHVISFNKGLAKIVLENRNRKSFILDFIHPLAFFSGPGMFTDNIHHFTITAMEPSIVCLIPMDLFLEVMKNNAKVSLAFIENSNNLVLSMARKMEGLLMRHHHGKVADALLYLSKDIYKSNPFKMNLSKDDLSGLTGMSKESVSRILHEFYQEKLISFNGKTYQLLKEERLKQISMNG